VGRWCCKKYFGDDLQGHIKGKPCCDAGLKSNGVRPFS